LAHAGEAFTLGQKHAPQFQQHDVLMKSISATVPLSEYQEDQFSAIEAICQKEKLDITTKVISDTIGTLAAEIDAMVAEWAAHTAPLPCFVYQTLCLTYSCSFCSCSNLT